MSTPDKCPHCGAERWSNSKRPGFRCRSVGRDQSDLCIERAAHAETRKREDALKLQFDQAVAQRDFWEKRCDEKDAEIAKERTAHAETKSVVKQLADVVVGIQSQFEAVIGCELTPPFLPDDAKAILADLVADRDTAKAQLTREREKWEKFRTWVGCDSFANGSLIHSSEIAKKMNILDAEAKEGK